MNNEFCQSCGMPLKEDTKHDHSITFCKYCADENGKLNPREAVQAGIAEWLKMFTPSGDGVDFMKRADLYLQAMPAWAE
ncbi:MAG: hypothetical protein MJE63_28160 [Proteobacteria bacterium]|nr:hypothetical protein [Pseudomonadota bacterium]